MQINFSDRLQQILDAERMTIYKASEVVKATTGEALKTIHRRISRWIKDTPQTWKEIEKTLDGLGYEIVIQRKKK